MTSVQEFYLLRGQIQIAHVLVCKIVKENAIIKGQGKPRYVNETTPSQPGIFKAGSECFATIYKGNI